MCRLQGLSPAQVVSPRLMSVANLAKVLSMLPSSYSYGYFLWLSRIQSAAVILAASFEVCVILPNIVWQLINERPNEF